MNVESVSGTILLLALFAFPLRAQEALRHPDAANLANPPGTVLVVNGGPLSTTSSAASLALRLSRLVVADSVGAGLDDDTLEFGIIGDVAVGNGRIAVLDLADYRVLLLDKALRPIGSVGRQGAGPLEFRSPLAVHLGADDRVSVYDRALGLKTFTIDDSRAARLAYVARYPVVPSALCFTADGAIALAPSSLRDGVANRALEVEPLLASVAPDGSLRRSFGESYRSTSPLARRVMSEGVVACGPQGEAVVGFSSLPFIRVYSAEGRLTRTLRLEDFQLAVTLEGTNDRGQLSIGKDPTTREWSSTVRALHATGSLFVVQVARMRVSRRGRGVQTLRLDSYVVDATSGASAYAGRSLPLLVAVEADAAFGFSNDALPVVYRLQAGPPR